MPCRYWRPASLGSVNPAASGSARTRSDAGGATRRTKRSESGPSEPALICALSFAMICGLSLSRRYSLSFVLGVGLDEEPLAVRMKLPVDFDDLAAHGEHPGGRVEIPDPEFGQLPPSGARSR